MAGDTRLATLLFTDIEGSSRLWERYPGQMPEGLRLYEEFLGRAIAAVDGDILKATGDGHVVVFDSPPSAVRAALAVQRALASDPWPGEEPFRVRMAIHTGPALARGNDLFGPTLNRTARVMGLAHGGQVLLTESAAVLAREHLDDGVSLRDLGEHRLRDLSVAERVYQLVAQGIDDGFSPVRSMDNLPTNLPIQLTSFVGRDADIIDVTNLLSNHRLVTLTGSGGVGKTRIALQVAAEVLPEYHDGVWLVELAPAENEESVQELIAQTLRVAPRVGMSTLGSIVEVLRHHRTLIVLDNCEHVIDSAAGIAEELLRSCAGVKVLATSREGLGVDGEQLRAVRSLTTPPATASTDQIMASDASQLFLDRARSVNPNFDIDSGSAAAVGEIGRRLDGIPLALELAAARVATLQPGEIAKLLDERFRLLTGGRRRSVERHQTLRATVDWSYSLLSDIERSVFDRLGVFSGSFDARSAEVVVAGDEVNASEVLDALAELVAKSMVSAEPAILGTSRYQMLETMRQYAVERLEADHSIDTFRQRHATHFMDVAQDIGLCLFTPEEGPTRARFAAELDNLRSAVAWASDTGRLNIALGILYPLSRESAYTRSSEVWAWNDRAMAVRDAGDSDPRWRGVQISAAWARFFRGDLESARAGIDDVLAGADKDIAGDTTWALMLHGLLLTMHEGDIDGAIQSLTNTLEATRADAGIDALSIPPGLAMVSLLNSDFDLARAAADEGVRRSCAAGIPSQLAYALGTRGWVLRAADTTTARQDLEESIALYRAGASGVAYGLSLFNLAALEMEEGLHGRAAELLIDAISLSWSIGDRNSLPSPFWWASILLARTGRFESSVIVAEGAKTVSFGTALTLEPRLTASLQEALELSRAELGGDLYQGASDRAVSMSIESMIDFVLLELRTVTSDA